ncbi:PBECR2 nuclease fold domain-containing protein [Azonexus sp.]|uniref:PBECR2 nuclease fold domain-containing protein n=1 Tax=Azonexus sp. TaxID=1872668 RepID=UPI0027B8DF99|nr:PBECR2 nuclease fold domain-containing protein [Azonexus sp.]
MTNPAYLPFTEAADFFAKKIKLPSSGWTDIWQEQHSHAFVIAGATSDDLVEDFYNAIAKAKESGGFAEFQKAFPEIVKKHGWSHNGTPGWRSKIIYDTNVDQAYNAGREQQMQAIKHLRPYGLYDHTSIEHPRLEHKAWDGLIIPLDDIWWDTHSPKNGWGCKCRKRSLSRVEAERRWKKAGKTGPDQAPPIEWEERVVGKNGSNPRTVRVPKGIDPGFAYSPGKAFLEPHTVPPLQGYDAVLKERGTPWPTNSKRPSMPSPTTVPSSVRLPAGTPPEIAVDDFLDVFGATVDQGVAFTDAAGSTLAITKALFEDGSGDFKWLSSPNKAARLESINLLAMTLIEPDEIWWGWVKDHHEKGRWRLKRRYLRAFQIEGTDEYGFAVFEWGSSGWSGATTFMGTQKSPEDRAAYFDKQRIGRLLFKK